jgi:hypothetical protein
LLLDGPAGEPDFAPGDLLAAPQTDVRPMRLDGVGGADIRNALDSLSGAIGIFVRQARSSRSAMLWMIVIGVPIASDLRRSAFHFFARRNLC